MKKLLFTLLLFPVISFCQNETPTTIKKYKNIKTTIDTIWGSTTVKNNGSDSLVDFYSLSLMTYNSKYVIVLHEGQKYFKKNWLNAISFWKLEPQYYLGKNTFTLITFSYDVTQAEVYKTKAEADYGLKKVYNEQKALYNKHSPKNKKVRR